MTKAEAGRLGGLKTLERHGIEHFRRAGSKGFWATLNALAQRQTLGQSAVNPYRHLLRNLKARKKCNGTYKSH